MELEKLNSKAKEIFLSVFSKTLDKEFKFNESTLDKSIFKFIQEITPIEHGLVSVGVITDYMICQAHAYREWEKWSRVFMASWFFSEKAISRFYEAKPGLKYYEDKWLSSFGLDRGDLKMSFISKEEHPMRKYIHMEAEESTKRRFLNQDVGYGLCVESTLMWSPMSEVCRICDYKQRCLEALKKAYPELYRLRTE